MLKGDVGRDVHHDRHDKAALVLAPHEPVLLLPDSSSLLLRAVNEVHYEIVVRCRPCVPRRHSIDYRLELLERLVDEFGGGVAEDALGFVVHGEDLAEIALAARDDNHSVLVREVDLRVLQSQIPLLVPLVVQDLGYLVLRLALLNLEVEAQLHEKLVEVRHLQVVLVDAHEALVLALDGVEPLIDGGAEIEYVIDIDVVFLAELHPEPLSDLAGPFDALLVLNVQLLELNDLGYVALSVEILALSGEDLLEVGAKVFYDSKTQSVGVVGVRSSATPTDEGQA